MRRTAEGEMDTLARLPSGGLPNLDQVPVRIAHVAADLGAPVLRRREELGPARAPLLVHGLDVGHADVEEAADPIRVPRRLERDGGLVLRGAAADVDDDPAVGERHERRLALADRLTAEHAGVEAPRALYVVGDDEVRQHDLPLRRDGLRHGLDHSRFPSGPRFRLRSSSSSPNSSRSCAIRLSSSMKLRPRRSTSSSDRAPPSIRRSAWRSISWRSSSTTVRTSCASPRSSFSGSAFTRRVSALSRDGRSLANTSRSGGAWSSLSL